MKIRVVVADDFPMVRESIVRALARDPAIEVLGEAADGHEALALARDLQPDVMVLDLHMPQMGGVEVLQHLRRAQSPTRVIVVTASEQASVLHDAIAAGAAAFLSKRSTGDQLRNAVISVHGGCGIVITPSLAELLVGDDAAAGDHGRPALTTSIRPRERDVLQLVAEGRTDAEIGLALGVSSSTVNRHLTHIREKTGLHRRAALVSWAIQHASLDEEHAERVLG
jgi:DNA-binding NarL/FixJ family response regulator